MGVEPKGAIGRTSHLEFGGVIGAAAMIVGLPIAVYYLNLACNPTECSAFVLPKLDLNFSTYFDWDAMLIFLAWFGFQVIVSLLPFGQVHQGLVLRTGERLDYRCNAFVAFLLSVGGFFVMFYSGQNVAYVYEKFIAIATTAIVFAFLLAVYLYVRSLSVESQHLAIGGNSGNPIYDFFIGRELNPRIGPLDLKFFCELRPGLIGWVMLDLCFCAKAYTRYGELPPALLLVTFFHAFYVADALWFEPAILTTMDIVTDGFGLMLAFGDLAWVPFLYSLQARFCLEHPPTWSTPALFGFLVMHLVGYSIFRGANSQKNKFRQNPNDPSLAHLKTLSTKSGRKLLVSGWWGICRHPNYLGDLIMALSWSLPTGGHLLTYFYPIYFLGLLIHRFSRDGESCQAKYGEDWQKYCKLVPYKIFPYIY